MNKKIKKIIASREFLLLSLIIIVFVVVGVKSEHFLTLSNLAIMFANISVYMIVGVGMTVLFISGGFDMSTGTHFSFLTIMTGLLLKMGVPVALVILMILILGIVDGLIIGIIITKFDINPFVATLGAMFIFKGAAFIIGMGSDASVETSAPVFDDFPESFLRIAKSTFYEIEYINFYMIIIIIFFYFFLSKNLFLRNSYYVGGDIRAAKLAGIKTTVVLLFNYSLVSVLVAISAILKTSRINTASGFAGGLPFSLLIITAVILGGASLSGGKGSIIGTFFSIVLLVLINNGIGLLRIESEYNSLIIGVVLLFSVFINEIINKRSNNKFFS